MPPAREQETDSKEPSSCRTLHNTQGWLCAASTGSPLQGVDTLGRRRDHEALLDTELTIGVPFPRNERAAASPRLSRAGRSKLAMAPIDRRAAARAAHGVSPLERWGRFQCGARLHGLGSRSAEAACVKKRTILGRAPSSAASAVLTDDSSESRAFYRARLVLFMRLIATLSGLFYLANLVVALVVEPAEIVETLTHSSAVAHLLGTLIAAACWALARGVGARALDAVDFAGSSGISLMYALMIPGEHAGHEAETAALLATSWTLVARAALVPTTMQRTAAIGVVGLVPCIAASYYAAGYTGGQPALRATNVAFWAVIAVSVTTVISRIIYGLRREVQHAMRVGQYTLIEILGAGAMGVVYRAPTADRDQDPSARSRQCGRGSALRARGAAHEPAHTPEHGGDLRLRSDTGRAFLLRHGAARGHDPRAARSQPRSTGAIARRAHPRPVLWSPAGGARSGPGPSRHQAGERHAHVPRRSVRCRQGARLRAREEPAGSVSRR